MNIEEKMKALGIDLPELVKPSGNYAPAVCAGDLLFTAGQTPKVNGKLRYTGKLGAELTVEEGYQAAQLCVINCLAIIKQTAGDLEHIEQIVKMNGYINSAPDFYDQITVLNGATDLLQKIFEDKRAIPARSAIGVAVLPNNAACEIELIVRMKSK